MTPPSADDAADTASTSTSARESVDLSNCDVEPIHIPGTIQPHGHLFVFDRNARLVAYSANAKEFTGSDIRVGVSATDFPWLAQLTEDFDDALADLLEGETVVRSGQIEPDGRPFDYFVHAYGGRVLVEFEYRLASKEESAEFAWKAHVALDRLKRQRHIEPLLDMAVEQVRAITGFDRVVAYRFRHDQSGDVVAESVVAEMEPFIGRRYPASDIPAQARRLYTLNTLRFIASTEDAPVSIVGDLPSAPIDLSHAVLRSVSPIHLEYLRNMGVAASMSVSLLVDGQLWGLIACHHRTPKRVPASSRMACDVIAQVLSTTLQSLLDKEYAAEISAAATLRSALMQAVLEAENMLTPIVEHSANLLQQLKADALIISHSGKLYIHGDVSEGLAKEIVETLNQSTGYQGLITFTRREEWPQHLHRKLGRWAGLLAMCFDVVGCAWIIGLRLEQIETVRWAGKPEKVIKVGPMGARLTPRGSFEEWKETVRNSAEPWSDARQAIAQELLSALLQVSNKRHAETERTRTQLLAMLGHDLRDPLNSISMAARVLERGQAQPRLGERIRQSSSRMQNLVNHVLDLSRINSGLGLGLKSRPVDLRMLVADLVDEVRVAHPGVNYQFNLPRGVTADCDPDRIAQVLSNLLSNARHHGEIGKPITIELYDQEGQAIISVRNQSPRIPVETEAQLFNAFKAESIANERNRGGLGLGLFIASEIMKAHDGELFYRYQEPEVVFTLKMPLGGETADVS
ncbi:MAG: GAF domain-containing protein [Gammaproteobacteria bacterium]|nr:GAF domain-containing protein [Gammaproteobacteria bacterium]